jgi:DNA-directed RNA polymerase subunit beta
MGTNVQRQGVPLLLAEAPLVGTDIEEKIARDSGHVRIAQQAGIIASVDGGGL